MTFEREVRWRMLRRFRYVKIFSSFILPIHLYARANRFLLLVYISTPCASFLVFPREETKRNENPGRKRESTGVYVRCARFTCLEEIHYNLEDPPVTDDFEKQAIRDKSVWEIVTFGGKTEL